MKQYVVDAFTEKVFAGNPAAVCVMDKWLSDDLMQKIAIENNLSETAFAVKNGENYDLRWFTPGGEVELCGHATLATAYVITRFIEPNCEKVKFMTKSGLLTVTKKEDLLEMDFPSFELKPADITEDIIKAVGCTPLEVYLGADTVVVLENEEQVRAIVPNDDLTIKCDGLCLHVTARGKDFDCVTRSFVPKCNVTEDPVCGRAHCHVVGYWANKLGKNDINAYQASPRGGELYCTSANERTIIRGKATLFSQDEMYID